MPRQGAALSVEEMASSAYTPARTGRSGAIDAVRVVGILAVIAGHTLGAAWLRPLLYSWHVPLFFVLAGYFWSTHRGVGVELGKRWRTLMLPYVSWFALIAVPFVLLDAGPRSYTWSRLFVPLVDGQHSAMAFTTFWFVSVLFACCVLLRLLQTLPPVSIWAIALAAAGAGWLFGPQLARTPLSLGTALPCLIFVVLGSAARRLRERMRIPVGSVPAARVAVVVLGACAAIILAGASAPVDVKQGDFGTPVLSCVTAVAIALCLVLLAERVFAVLPRRVGAAVSVLAYGGFMVVLTHPLVMWLLETFAPAVPSWAVFALCVAVPWGAALLVLRTPLSPWLTGVPRLRRRVVGVVTS